MGPHTPLTAWDWIPQRVARILDVDMGPALYPVRAEMFGNERFAQHGRSLGDTHRAAKAKFGQATFYPRLRDNIHTLRAAHHYILEQADCGHDLSPAAQWLLDNFHLIEAQLREIHDGLPYRYYKALPVLQDEPLVGLPRIYGVAWAFVAHTDGVFNGDLLVHFLSAYQERRELTQGEMWALPTTLRVVLIENLRRLADRVAAFKAARELANLCADRLDILEVAQIQALLDTLTLRGVGPVFLAHFAQSLQGRRTATDGEALTHLRQWIEQIMPDVPSVQAQHNADQVADNLSVGNAVNALRLIGSVDWSDIVARSSLVVQVMLHSPVFVAEDAVTRDHTLHAIERLSHQTRQGEAWVAKQLLAQMAHASGPAALAWHWLSGPGRSAFERQLGVQGGTARAWRTLWRLSRVPAYLVTLLLVTVGSVLWLIWQTPLLAGVGGLSLPSVLLYALTMLSIGLPMSEAVVALVNRLISESVRPVHLPRFALEHGIAPAERVLVVIPSILSDEATIRHLLHHLLLHHLASNETHAQFALLTDWPDAPTEQASNDDTHLNMARQGIEHLNRTHPTAEGGFPRFLLLHRARQYSPTQQVWMGWERKRGKLEQLVAAMTTGVLAPFMALGDASRLAPNTRHLLTLDSDTRLPPGQLRALVAVAAHPQNEPILDATGRYVVSGYGILQPRITAPLTDPAAHTLYHWLMSSQQGMDPYSAMTSDVYQDLFGEGSFTGKGLINVRVMHAVLNGRLPSEQVLSHDLLEGALVRCAVVSDVTLIEAEPNRADVARSRLHRWTRGDWQLLVFLLRPGPWPMAPINRWKMWDNLRRSLVAPASVWLLVSALLGVGLTPAIALAVVWAAYAAGPLMGTVAGLMPVRADFAWHRYYREAAVDVCRTGLGGLWHISQLLQQAVSHADAIGRTVYRMAISRRHLIQWTTAATLHRDIATGWRSLSGRKLIGPTLAATALLTSVLAGVSLPPLLLVLLGVWVLAPVVSAVVSTCTLRRPTRGPTREEALYLHHVARDTWRLFERVVDASNHHLPPDNLQTSPADVVAPRTSPTNIGLYLLSVACARSFGWLGTLDMLDRLEATLSTLARLQRHEGHFLNWYDTQTLQPLHPRYVSTVDSGNLSAHLLAVAEACQALAAHPFDPDPAKHAIARAQARPSVNSRLPFLREAVTTLQTWWQTDLADTLASARHDAHAMANGDAPATALRLLALAQRLEALAWEASFTFLYHPNRHLLHIGYRVDDQVLDASYYDLLASESCMTSLLAIAKGDVPIAHWAALGRPYFAVGSLAGLRSWSGSMFEYLMPSLVLRAPDGSVLREAGAAAVREQMAYQADQQVPWGMSESAYAGRDHTLAYQYAPQGVPRLALRRTPDSEWVVAPYATALAAQVDTRSACANFYALEKMGARGPYGFCEAADFTPSRQSHGGPFTLVHTYMAHHQGMSIVALANVLLSGIAQRWGMANPRIEAAQWLLHERAPRQIPVLHSPPPRLPVQALLKKPSRLTPSFTPGAQTVEPTHLMSNGRYSVSLRPNGAGWSRWGGLALTRWRDDAPRDAHGSFVYLRLDAMQGPMSVTQHPAPDDQATYLSIFHVDRVVFEARWPNRLVVTTVWVSPEDDIEFRKVVVTNHSLHTLELEVLSAFDVTLCPQAADEAHPAFSNLFVQAQWLPDQQAILFTRKPRLPTENPFQAAHFIAATEGDVTRVQMQTDRQAWLGRNHAPSGPQADLLPVPNAACTLVTGLDPVSVLAVSFIIAPGAQAVVTFAMAASDHPVTLRAVIDKHHQASTVERASLMSATLAGIETRPHHLYPEFLSTFQTLTTALVFTLPRMHRRLVVPPHLPPACCDRRLLWSLSISGDRPLLLVTIGDLQGLGLLRVLVQSLREWAHCGVPCDVVVLSNEVNSYLMVLHRELLTLREQHLSGLRNTPQGLGMTGLHVHRTEDLSADQLSTLTQRASLCIQADGRSLHHHVRTWADAQQHGASGSASAAHPVYAHRPTGAIDTPTGTFDAQGHFSFDVNATTRPTRPWINVLANPDFGTQVSEAGGGHTWAINSRLNQLTPWRNDPVADVPGEWLLLQDRRTNAAWSVSPSAWSDPSVTYHVTHGQGLTTIQHQRAGLNVTATWCVDADTAVKHIRLELVNMGHTRLHLRILALAEWQMGEKASDRATTRTTCLSQDDMGCLGTTLLCQQLERTSVGAGQGTAFLTMPMTQSPDLDGPDWTCDRREFFGPQGQFQLPLHLGQSSGQGLDPCAALARRVTLRPGQRLTQVFLLGYADTSPEATALAAAAMQVLPEHRENEVVATWNALLDTCVVSTPDPLFDALVNRWLLYQTLSSRLWAKAGYYQVGGATGFRDQLQDAMALTWARPDLLRQQIVVAASRQFEAGDVQHWWHMPGGAGVRTHFSDDLLWLPYACTHYLHRTGDTSLLDTVLPFLAGTAIPEGAEDSYTTPFVSDTQATVYEHAARAIDHSLHVGVHGLPLMGTGDWNDGMNRVGHGGQGESVWLAWFLCAIVADWIPLAHTRHEFERAARWEGALVGWRAALDGPAWDGAWYTRAFFDDGSALGSHANSEARIDVLAQAWAVLSGAAPVARQQQAMSSVETHLVDSAAGLIQLLAPPLVDAQPHAGYIQAYPPGIRENGGQYAHAGVWALMAAARLARHAPATDPIRDTPYRYFTYLSPAHRTEDAVRRHAYGLEPYAMAADVYSQPPYVGRGGWSWYTGAAGWLHRAAIESIFGLDWQSDTLTLWPCLPTHWQRAQLTMTRDAHTIAFTLYRGNAEELRQELLAQDALLLPPGQPLAWANLPPISRYVVPLSS